MKREIIRVEPLLTYLERSLILKITVSRLGDAGASLGPHLDNELSSHLGYINDKVEGRNYLLGDKLTAADIQLSFFGELASARTGIASYPNIGAWVNRFQARPPTRPPSNAAALTALLNCHFASLADSNVCEREIDAADSR
jgi:glutathione S-transferase